MILGIEIGLTVWAWRRGWRWRALLPIAIGLPVAFAMGFAIGLTGGSDATVQAVGLVLDLGLIGVLVLLVARAPQREASAVPSIPVDAVLAIREARPVVGPEQGQAPVAGAVYRNDRQLG